MARFGKQRHVARQLMRHLGDGRWSPGPHLPSSSELAAELGVSQNTMLSALRRLARLGLLEITPRRPCRILPDARQRALKHLARHAGRAAPERVALLLPERYMPLESHFDVLTKIMIAEANRQGVTAETLSWPENGQVAFVQSMLNRGFGVFVIVGLRSEYIAALHEMSRLGVPTILYNRWLPWLHFPIIRRDDYAAAKRIASMLASLGHRRMVMITDKAEDGLVGGRDPHLGWRDALVELGLLGACSPAVLVIPGVAEGQSLSFLDRLLTGSDAPTAIVFAKLFQVERLLVESCLADFVVPQQVSMVTFDSPDAIPVGPNRPRLTSAEPNYHRMAECLFETARLMLAGERSPPNIRVPLNIVVTSSIGPVADPVARQGVRGESSDPS